MNSLPKHVQKHERLTTYQDALTFALGLKILLLGVQGKPEGVRIEGVLRSFFAPQYNHKTATPHYSGNERLSDLMAAADAVDLEGHE